MSINYLYSIPYTLIIIFIIVLLGVLSLLKLNNYIIWIKFFGGEQFLGHFKRDKYICIYIN